MKTIAINIIKEMDKYDEIIDNVTIYAKEWCEDGTVVMLVNAAEYEECFAAEVE